MMVGAVFYYWCHRESARGGRGDLRRRRELLVRRHSPGLLRSFTPPLAGLAPSQ